MIDVTRDGTLWRVVLNRPDKANSLTRDMLAELADVAEAAAIHASAFVLTGTGSVFSAGADLAEARAGLATDPLWERLSNAVACLPCLTIAALNGTLAGGAFGMVLACDLRVCVPETKFFYPVMKLGFLPQPSDPARLTALVGPARAKLVLMAGQTLMADDALQFGLVDAVVPKQKLEAWVTGACADVLKARSQHVSAIKKMIS